MNHALTRIGKYFPAPAIFVFCLALSLWFAPTALALDISGTVLGDQFGVGDLSTGAANSPII